MNFFSIMKKLCCLAGVILCILVATGEWMPQVTFVDDANAGALSADYYVLRNMSGMMSAFGWVGAVAFAVALFGSFDADLKASNLGPAGERKAAKKAARQAEKDAQQQAKQAQQAARKAQEAARKRGSMAAPMPMPSTFQARPPMPVNGPMPPEDATLNETPAFTVSRDAATTEGVFVEMDAPTSDDQ